MICAQNILGFNTLDIQWIIIIIQNTILFPYLGDPAGDKETSSTTIASIAANYCGIQTMLHMTCANLTKDTVVKNLTKTQKLGLRNILALRGG